MPSKLVIIAIIAIELFVIIVPTIPTKISKTGELLEFKEGAFLLAKRAKAPVVVITTKGTNQIAKNKLLKSTKVELDVIEIIDKETVQAMTLSELAMHVRTSVEGALQ